MNYGSSAWTDFTRSDPGVLGEIRGYDEIEPGDDRPGRYQVGLRQRNDYIRPDVPAVAPLDGGRRILRVAFRGAGVDPGRDGAHIGFGEARVVLEMPVLRVGKPGRHLAGDDGGFHRLGPWPGALVAQHGERSGFAGPVADLAV